MPGPKGVRGSPLLNEGDAVVGELAHHAVAHLGRADLAVQAARHLLGDDFGGWQRVEGAAEEQAVLYG